MDNDHDTILKVLHKKIIDVKKALKNAESELKEAHKTKSTKIDTLELAVYELTLFLHDLEVCEKRLLPKEDDVGNITSLSDLIDYLSKPENRMAEGRRLGLAQLCTERERERLSQVIEYPDGSFDVPLLTPEGVRKAHQEEEDAARQELEID